jgi:hypothetical protein
MWQTIWRLIQQRRVWIAVFAAVSFTLKMFGINLDPDAEAVIIDQVMILVSLIPDVLTAIFALWSYIRPKPSE